MLKRSLKYVVLESLPIAIGVGAALLFFSVTTWHGPPPAFLVILSLIAVGTRVVSAFRMAPTRETSAIVQLRGDCLKSDSEDSPSGVRR